MVLRGHGEYSIVAGSFKKNIWGKTGFSENLIGDGPDSGLLVHQDEGLILEAGEADGGVRPGQLTLLISCCLCSRQFLHSGMNAWHQKKNLRDHATFQVLHKVPDMGG